VVKCDSGTSDNYWSGSVLGDAFANYTLLLTNGSGIYCGTQQEDNATLESLLRGAISKKLDFSRIILMRTISDFDRAPPDETEVYHLIYADQEGFEPSISNIYIAGIEIVKDVLSYWNTTYEGGIKPGNYVGDLWNSLDSEVAPDIGTEAIYIN
jgi:purine nucleoside permease